MFQVRQLYVAWIAFEIDDDDDDDDECFAWLCCFNIHLLVNLISHFIGLPSFSFWLHLNWIVWKLLNVLEAFRLSIQVPYLEIADSRLFNMHAHTHQKCQISKYGNNVMPIMQSTYTTHTSKSTDSRTHASCTCFMWISLNHLDDAKRFTRRACASMRK